MAGRYNAYVDWNADGDFSDPRENVTSDVLDGRFPVTMQYGRDQQRALSPIAPGEARFALDNQSRIYSPENAASPLADQVVPSRSVLITGTVGVTTVNMVTADLDNLTLMPSREDRYLSIECVDALGQLRGTNISTGVYQGLRPGEAMAVLLDAVGWPAALRDLDVGATTMPFWWLDNQDAFDAMLDLVATEGPPSLVTSDGSGRIVFRSRHARLQNAASTAVQSTWRSGGGIEPLISAPADYNAGFKEIVNAISFQLPQLTLSELDTVFTQPGQVNVTSGDTVEIVVQADNPIVNAISPVPGVDYTTVAGSSSVTLSRTSGASVTIYVSATFGDLVISDLTLRAQTVVTASNQQVTAEDAASILKYGRSSLPLDRVPKWASLPDAKAICSIILGQRGERLPTISVTMKSANTTRLTQQLTRNLGDRVHIVETHSGLDADCYIEQIAHTITQGGAEHATTFGLEKAPVQASGTFILGSATLGVLGTNKLGRRGLANPATMFVLGSGTNGLLGTNILTA